MHLLPVVLALAGCFPRSAPARCSCIPVPRLTSRADAAALLATGTEAVFEGRILTIRRLSDSTLLDSASGRRWRHDVLVATVRVTRRWSPDIADSVQVETMEQTTMCGMHLVAGRRYLFVAQGPERSAAERTTARARPTATWSVSKCGYSRPWDREARRLARLFDQAQRRRDDPGGR